MSSDFISRRRKKNPGHSDCQWNISRSGVVATLISIGVAENFGAPDSLDSCAF